MTLLGIDTSRWEDNPATTKTIDWIKAKAAGVAFVIMKATEGPSYVDPVFSLHAGDTKGILPRGSYHFFRTAYSASSQAKNYASVAAGQGLELPPCLDLEDWYADLPKGTALQTRLIDMLNAIDQAFGRECMLYTSPNILKYYLPLDLSPEITKRKLWIANYGVPAPVIAPFKKWTFWQYSESGNAAAYGINEASEVDENLYNGTQAEFNAEFGLAPTTPPPSSEYVTLKSVKVAGVLVPGVVTVQYDSPFGPSEATIDQTPATQPPSVHNLYRVASELWPLNHKPLIKPGGGGPLTQTMSHTPKQIYAETPLTPDWITFIGYWNNDIGLDKIKAPDFGPSKGFNSAHKLRYVGLVWPSNSKNPNVVRVLEISGAWARIDSIPMGNLPTSEISPEVTPWLFHRVCDANGNPVMVQGDPIICPILGGPWWVPMSALSKL